VPQDPIRAYVLLALAAGHATGTEVQRYGSARDTVASSLTAAQLSEAQSLARQGTVPWPASER
jgi:hypothetical protein